jgi:chromosome segregation ATPase
MGGGGKAELKLLACQRTDQSWSTVPGEELIPAPAEEANNLSHGQLLLVELGANKQVQRILPDTAKVLVTRLENFSRQLEKSKKQEEEIEQWKQSLTYQSQELNRREMEMEARLEQLQQIEEDFERLEQQRQEIDSAREETEKLREEFERSRQEMEGAWEHLRGEQRRLEERQTEFQSAAVLDDEQAQKIQALLDRLSGAIAPTAAVREQLHLAVEVVNARQAALDPHWQQLSQQQQTAQNLSAEVERQTESLTRRQQESHELQASLEQAKMEMKVHQNALEIKRESSNRLRLQIQNQNELHEEISRLAISSSDVKIGQKIDLAALEKMPLGELQETVQNLQRELEKMAGFVNSQEEELTDKRQIIEELQAKIRQASEYDRLTLETDLAEEQDGYQMLDETLVGQRRNLREREEILAQHSRIWRRRQGIVENDAPNNQKIDLGPILSQLDAQRQQQQEELRHLDNQIEQMQSSIQQTQGIIDRQVGEQDVKHRDLQTIEQNLQQMKVSAAELWGKVNLYQEMLQPMQDGINELRQKLEAIAEALNQVQETGDYQLQAISEMRQTVNNLTQSP